MRKIWYEKMRDKPGYPKVLTLEEGFPCFNAVHKMGADPGDPVVIVNPSEVIPLMTSVPLGKVVTIIEICKHIAMKRQVKGCCSLVTGIYTMTIANVVEECRANGTHPELLEVPWWRTLKSEGYLNEKYPGGQEAHKARLESEGFRVIARGSKYQVMDWQDRLVVL
jgi:alkylated DNA nucleotide flippase Atl1